jgi:hypothetical protein
MAIQQQIIKGHFNCKSSDSNSVAYDNSFSFVAVSLPQKKTLLLKPKVERYHTYILDVIKVIVITETYFEVVNRINRKILHTSKIQLKN